METKVEYELMTPDEVIAAREKTSVAFVPIGPIEWHGPHLPLGTDGLHAHEVAVRVARIVGGVVLPTLYAGTETVRLPGTGAQQLGAIGFRGDERIVGMDFPRNPVKSIYYEESAFGVTVRPLVAERPDALIRGVEAHYSGHHQHYTHCPGGGHGIGLHRRVSAAPSSALLSRPTVDVCSMSSWEHGRRGAAAIDSAMVLCYRLHIIRLGLREVG